MATCTITITDVPAIRKKGGVGSVEVGYSFDPPITKGTKNTAALHLASVMIAAANKSIENKDVVGALQ